MEIRKLRVFLALKRELHFGRAAESMNMPQSAFSAQLKSLEADLGVSLFERTTRRVTLTAAGRQFSPEAEKTLAAMERAILAARAGDGEQPEQLRVGGVESGVAGLLPSMISDFRDEYERVEIIVDEIASTEAFRRLENHALDVAFVRRRRDEEHVRSEYLLTESIVVALPRAHRLANSRSVDIAYLSGEPMVIAPRLHCPILYDTIQDYMTTHGATQNIVQETSERHILLAMVSSSLGFALVPECLKDFNPKGVVFLPLSGKGVAVDLYAVWRANEEMHSVSGFIRHLRQETLKKSA